jgi:hypothetical protein
MGRSREGAVRAEFSDLVGQTVWRIDQVGGLNDQAHEEMLFRMTDGWTYRLYHDEDCCESVRVEDVVGDLDDLIGLPLVLAEETSNHNEGEKPSEWSDSWTWTFYRLATPAGHVTIRWLGESNGYYSEGVSVERYRTVEA